MFGVALGIDVEVGKAVIVDGLSKLSTVGAGWENSGTIDVRSLVELVVPQPTRNTINTEILKRRWKMVISCKQPRFDHGPVRAAASRA